MLKIKLFLFIFIARSFLCTENDTNSTETTENEIKDNELKEKRVSAVYGQFDKCKGRFSRIQMDVIDTKCEWKCDHAWIHQVNVSSTGYCNVSRNSLDTLSDQIIKDFNGTENYSSIGIVLNGECKGAKLVVQSELKVTKGNCDTGVTELYSRTYSSLIAVRGICETTCYGTIWHHYWPAKFSKQLE